MPATPFATLPRGLRTELREASSTLGCLARVAPEAIEAAPDQHFAALRHELSAHYLALHDPEHHFGRSRLEAQVLEGSESQGGILTSSPHSFRERLSTLNQKLAGGSGGWRAGSVRLGDDRMGSRIYFPPVSAVPGQLERVRLVIAGRDSAPPLFTAAVAYLLLLNCHPFTDGNGRTARVLFNHLLHRGGMPRDVYLPLYDIALRSNGGYEIALRIAELRGDWEPFFRFIMNAIRCHREIAAAAIESSSHA